MVDNRRLRTRSIVYQRFALRFEDDEDGKMEDAFLAELVTLQVSGLKAAALCITVICALWTRQQIAIAPCAASCAMEMLADNNH